MPNSLHTDQQNTERKMDHIRVCQTQPVESSTGRSPFSQYHFIPAALPEMDLQEVCTKQTFLGRTFALPLLITGMTGGVQKGQQLNEVLAAVAQDRGIPMGLGSQKMMVQNHQFAPLFKVKKSYPKVFLIGNMGAVSLNYGVTLDHLKMLVEDCELDAMALHVNAMQECIQPEGERNFKDLYKKITQVVNALNVPVMIKEVGCGLSPTQYARLVETGVAAIDVGGRGGTSWAAVEGLRAQQALTKRLGELFRDWGYGTDHSLVLCRQEQERVSRLGPALVATGGIRNGLQVAKAVALGATMAGVGLPLFRAALSPDPWNFNDAYQAVQQELEFFEHSLRVTLFCAGIQNLSQLGPSVLTQSHCKP